MPSDLSPTSATTHGGWISLLGGLAEITVASTDSAGRNGSPTAPYAVSISAYDPAWISVATVLSAYVPVPPAETTSPPTSAAARLSRAMQSAVSVRRSVGVGEQHEVALVAHHAAHLEPRGPGQVGDPAGVLGRAAAAREADVDVDEHLAHPAGRGRRDGLGRVDRDGDPGPVGQRAEPARVEHLVGQQQVVAEPGRGHALDLADRRAGERRGARARPDRGPARWTCAP